MVTTIKEPARRKLGEAATQQRMSEDEYTRIKQLLGYNGMETDRGRATLASVLRELDISILDPRSVARYKKEKLVAARATTKRRYSWGRVTTWSWVSVDVKQYKRAVPMSALAVAAKVAERLPEAQFKVEELRQQSKIVDPFLYVVYKGAKYYLAHWDEPGFES